MMRLLRHRFYRRALCQLVVAGKQPVRRSSRAGFGAGRCHTLVDRTPGCRSRPHRLLGSGDSARRDRALRHPRLCGHRALQILGPEERIRPGFVWVPLAIRDAYGTASLASIITMTPGTLSVDLSHDRRHLLVHALHVDDPAELIASIKSRYEQPLMAIFEGEQR